MPVSRTVRIRKAHPLFPGDRIAVVAPASAPLNMPRLHQGVAHLEALGYAVERVRPDLQPHGYLAGSDDERLAAFNATLRRSDVQALFCVRGGYGTLRLLPHLDYRAARRYPKLLVGYSDITALQLALHRKAGWVGLSGPMVGVEWADPDPASVAQFWNLAQGTAPVTIAGPHGEALRPLRPGTAEGTLLGGNLAMVTYLLGTPYLPSLKGAILFVEDVGEAPYKVDALLAQLKLAGHLDQLGGLVFGAFTGWTPNDRPTLSYDEVIAEYTQHLPYPVATGLVYGHFPVKSAMPIGIHARLSVTQTSATLTTLEPIVQPL